MAWRGWLRDDGAKGIRNVVAVAYLVECARHVSEAIAAPWNDPLAPEGGPDVQAIGFPGCYPNAYGHQMLERLLTHANVGAAIIVSLGCEGFDRRRLASAVKASGRPVEVIVIQETGGTRAAIQKGRVAAERIAAEIAEGSTVEMGPSDLIVGTICGGSDGTSGVTGNPAAGRAFDRLIAEGGAGIFEETGELIGCEGHMAARAVTPELAVEVKNAVEKAGRYYAELGHASFAAGNADGGLTTIEEKSMGAYAKSGAAPIVGLLKPGDRPPHGGLYLLDVVPDGPVRFGFPNINDNAEIAELIACGAHMVLFVTGRGSVVGSAVSPVVKICANPETYARMADDMDVNAGRILEGAADLDAVGDEIYRTILDVAAGARTRSEALGHQEFILTYKSFEPAGPGCLPARH